MIDISNNISGVGLNQAGFTQVGVTGAAGNAALAAAVGATATDQYAQSEQSLFMTEYDKLSETEKQEVNSYLAELSAAKAAGDPSAVSADMPDFIQKMISMGVGDEEADEATIYNAQANIVAETAAGDEIEASASDRGVQVVEQKTSTSATAPEAEISSGEIKIMVSATIATDPALNAPAELQELAKKTGKNLSQVLEKYLDAGVSEQVAYT